MKTIKRQLRQFYAAQGIGARRAEKLIKSDLNAVRRYTDLPARALPERVLIQAMAWDSTPQGWQYWAVRHYGFPIESAKLNEHPSPLHA